jgi:hypothetical protein
MKTPEQIAAEVVDQLSFSTNRMMNGRLVGEQYFAAEAIAQAIKVDRARMAGSITMNHIRQHAGEGRLGYGTILWAVNHILGERARNQTDQGAG